MSDPASTAQIIGVSRKLEYLAELSEDDFRDKVVRPVLLSKKLTHGKDTCGVSEEGKDCYFFGEDVVGGTILYVVQTKKGDITMSRKADANLIEAVTQLRTALETSVKCNVRHREFFPAFVVLAASGRINKAARDHIVDQIKDPRIRFIDADSLIQDIDTLLPELWNGISVDKIPYLKNLRSLLLSDSLTIDVSEIGIIESAPAILDDTFAQLYLHTYRPSTRTIPQHIQAKRNAHNKATRTRVDNKVIDTIEVDEIKVQDILNIRDMKSLIIGDAGSGKTTSLRRIAMILLDKALNSKAELRIPVFTTAKGIADTDKPIVEFLTVITSALTPDGSSAFTMDDLTSGNVVLLVDALDEVGEASDREKAFTRLHKLHEQYPKVLIVVTSRNSPSITDRAKGLGFRLFYISPISFNQAETMINRLTKSKSLPKEATQEMLRRLENVHGLELNPLLVTVFVATSEYSRTDIPANITELFKKYTEMMLGRWNRTKTLGQQYEASVKDMLLCKVAYEIHAARETSIALSRFREIIDRELSERDVPADRDELYAEIVDQSGLVRVQDDELFFRHHLLQEFFAGRGIPSSEVLAKYATDVWWTKAIIFYFGQNPDDHHGLIALRNGVDLVIGADKFQAAIAVGLACQACYLMKKTHRLEALKWVVSQLVAEKDTAIARFAEESGGGDYVPFVWHYLYGRDAVAARGISDIADEVAGRRSGARKPTEEDDGELFWCIAGLIESHQLEKAEALIEKYLPTDFRLLLALHIGAVCVERLHVSSAKEKKLAKQILDKLDPLIDFMRPALIKELKGMLLEVRNGKVAVLDAPAEAKTPESELAD